LFAFVAFQAYSILEYLLAGLRFTWPAAQIRADGRGDREMSMREYVLPQEVRGKWIWLGRGAERLESYVFFRREVTLYETPVSAELWITARTRFQLYINGRYIAFGPPPSPSEHAYVVCMDVGFLVETGKNSIAVLAHNTSVSRFGARRHPSGLWMQLNINGEPAVWTDDSWLCKEADCFLPNQPRVSQSGAFAECVDVGLYPEGWQDKECNVRTWRPPDLVEKLSATDGRLEAVVSPQWSLEHRLPTAVLCRGSGRPATGCTWVSFGHLARERGGGVYVAEAFVYSAEDVDVAVEVYADDPYRLFANGQQINGQGVGALPPRADLNRSRQPCFGQADLARPQAVIPLHRGWNRLVLGQQVERDSAGVSLVLPGVDSGRLTCRRGAEDEAPSGWSLFGPFRTPLPLLSGNVELGSLPRVAFDPVPGAPADVAAVLSSWAFEVISDIRLPPLERVALRAGEYIVLDFGHTMYGCPELTVKGSDDDVLDVIWGEHFVNWQVPVILEGRRCVSTLIMGSGTATWRGTQPRGLRYLMLLARKAVDLIQVSGFGLCVRECDFPTPGAFSCSDAVLNEIWATGRRTLSSTMQVHFLDSPAKDQTQYITDAMIQSWAGYHTFGAYDLAGKSIEEFARVQFETGEMNAVCPSDMFLHMPDYSLTWPVWLQRHFLYTGDEALLERLLPNLGRLLDYYHSVALSGREVLANLHQACGAYCFLDHGDIDREGIVTGLNAIYCRALLSGAWLFSQAGDLERAAVLRRRAGRVAQTVRQLAWDEQRGLFADGWNDGQVSEFCSWQTNVLAIYGGIAEPEQYGAIFGKVFCDEPPYELFSAGDANNPFFKYFVLEAAFALERREWGLKLIRWYWGQMLERGAVTWWELFDPDRRSADVLSCSTCQGYGVSPNAYLCTELAGIRPAVPGFGMAYFNPLLGLTDWVKARIPTPRGHITVDWHFRESGEFEAMIDATHPLEVIPVLPPGIVETALIHVSDTVSILAEPRPPDA
jgi:hypothetical protein